MKNLTVQIATPHYHYSVEKGFDPKHYNVNGLIVNVQYNTKEHPTAHLEACMQKLISGTIRKF